MTKPKQFKVHKDIFTSDKPNYYRINNHQDLLDLFQDGLLTHNEYEGYLKGCCMKYLVRFKKKKETEADLNKLVVYAKKLRDLDSK